MQPDFQLQDAAPLLPLLKTDDPSAGVLSSFCRDAVSRTAPVQPDSHALDATLTVRLGPIALQTAIQKLGATEGLLETSEFLTLAATVLWAQQQGLRKAEQSRILGITRKTLTVARARYGLSGLSGPELERQIQAQGVQILDARESEQTPGWIVPGYDPLQLHDELIALIRSGRGSVDQKLMYLDLDSAASWLAFARMSAYLEMYATMPLDRAAAATLGCTGEAGLDVIALGPGGGEREVQFVQHLLRMLDQAGGPGTPRHRLHLIDISHPLLTVASQHAGQALLGRHVTTTAVQGDFTKLSRCRQFMDRPAGANRRRVVTMLGETFGNLLSEPHFVHESLGGMAPGDLFLIDVAVAPHDPAQDARIRGLPRDLRKAFEQWLLLPLRRHGALRQEESYTIYAERAPGFVPGSYSLDQVVRTQGGKSFSMTTVRRYSVASLAQSFKELGWRRVESFEFGQQGEMAHHRALLLFEKMQGDQGGQGGAHHAA